MNKKTPVIKRIKKIKEYRAGEKNMLSKSIKIILAIIYMTAFANASADITSLIGYGGIINTNEYNGDENSPDAAAYKKAYELVLDEKWSDAVKAFSGFLRQYPKSQWQDDAGFWLCYTKDKAGYKSEEVFKSYQDFITNHGNSKWADDARANMIIVGQKLVKNGKAEYKTTIDNLQKENNDEIKITALYALQNIGDDKALNAIIKLYDSTPDKEYKGKIIYALGNFDSPSAFDKLVHIAKTEKDPDLQKKAVYAISNADQKEAVKTLKDILAGSNAIEVRKAALYSLGNIDSPEIIPILKEYST